MKLSRRQKRDHCYRLIVLLGFVMTAVVTVLRLIGTAGLRNAQTGRFAVDITVVALLVGTVTVMILLAPRGGSHRVDIRGKGTMPLGLASLLAGGLIGIDGLWDVYRFAFYGDMPAPSQPIESFLPTLVVVLSLLLALASSVTLVLFGLQVIRENGTRVGMRSLTMLLPVLWVWLRLARYEMSYASAITLDKSFYDFAMFVSELLFLFKLARYTSGIGKTRPGSLLVYAMATGVLAISGPVTRFGLYLMGDSQAYLSDQLAGFADLAIGVLALCFGWSLYVTRRELRRYSSSSSGSPFRGLLFDDNRQ